VIAAFPTIRVTLRGTKVVRVCCFRFELVATMVIGQDGSVNVGAM